MGAEPEAHTQAWPKPVMLGVYHAFYSPAPTSMGAGADERTVTLCQALLLVVRTQLGPVHPKTADLLAVPI
jgi:hypothetical protein